MAKTDRIVGTTKHLTPDLFKQAKKPVAGLTVLAPRGWTWQIREKDVGRKNEVLRNFYRLIPCDDVHISMDIPDYIERLPGIIRLKHNEFPFYIEDMQKLKNFSAFERKNYRNVIHQQPRIGQANFYIWNTVPVGDDWRTHVYNEKSYLDLLKEEGVFKIDNELFWFIGGSYGRMEICWDLKVQDYVKVTKPFPSKVKDAWKSRTIPHLEDLAAEGSLAEGIQYQLKAAEVIEDFLSKHRELGTIMDELINKTELNSISSEKLRKAWNILQQMQSRFKEISRNVMQSDGKEGR